MADTAEPAAALPPVLVFPHLAKTGGTTVFDHFLSHYGADAICSIAPHDGMIQALTGQKLFDEWGPQDFAPMRMMLGHGLTDFEVARLAQHRDIVIVTILRGSAGLARSRYNHHRNALSMIPGGEMTPEEFTPEAFLDWHGTNPQATALTSLFPSFIDAGSKDPLQQAQSVLRKFNHVFATERLDAQCGPLLQRFGLPTRMERKRTAEDKIALPFDDATLAARHPVDGALHRAALDLVAAPQEPQNPFGYDPDAQAAALTKALERADERRFETYQKIAQYMSDRLMSETALLAIAKGVTDVADPDLYEQQVVTWWERKQRHISRAQMRISAHNRLQWLYGYSKTRFWRAMSRTKRRLLGRPLQD